MKTLLLIIPALLMAVQSFGQSYSVGVFVDTNGVLLYPTNLFQANSNRLNAAVSAIQVNSNDVVRPNFISTGDISWTGVDSEFYGTINDGAVSSGKLDAALYSWLQGLARVLVDSISASGFASGDDIEFYFDVSSNAIPRIKSGSLALSLIETNGFAVGQAPVFNGVTLEPGLILEANIDSAIARDAEMALLYQPLSSNLTQLAGLNGASLTNLNATNVVGVLSESNIDSAIMRDSEAALAFEPLNSGKYQATNSALTDFVSDGSTGSGAYARSNSPTFGGEPRVPTAVPGTSNTVAASTAFVADAVAGLGAGSGDVVGPASSTTNNLAAFDGATGKLLKDSGIATTNVQTVTGSVAAFEPLNANKYQATNAALTALAGNPSLYQGTNAVLTDVIASGSTGSGAFVRSNAPTITDPTLLGTVNTQTNNVGYLAFTNLIGTIPDTNIAATIARLASPALTGTPTVNGTNLMAAVNDKEPLNANKYQATNAVLTTLATLNASALTNLNASELRSGTVASARLGSGTADSTTYLRGDGTWNTPAGGSGASLSATNYWTAPQYFGTAAAATPAAGDNSTNVATTGWVWDALATLNQLASLTNSPQRYFAETDFGYGSSSGNSGPPWTGAAIASGAPGAVISETNHPAVLPITAASGATASGYQFHTLYHTCYRPNGLDMFTFVFRPLGTNYGNFTRAGFHDSITAANPTDAMMILRSNNIVAGYTFNNGTASRTASTYSCESNVWYRGLITSSLDLSSINFALLSDSGSVLWSDSVTSNIPINRDMGHGILCLGTNSIAIDQWDYMAVGVGRPLTR